MLSNKVGASQKLSVHGFLVGVELEDNSFVDEVMKVIGDALYTSKGVGTIDVEHLGEIETIDEMKES